MKENLRVLGVCLGAIMLLLVMHSPAWCSVQRQHAAHNSLWASEPGATTVAAVGMASTLRMSATSLWSFLASEPSGLIFVAGLFLIVLGSILRRNTQ